MGILFQLRSQHGSYDPFDINQIIIFAPKFEEIKNSLYFKTPGGLAPDYT